MSNRKITVPLGFDRPCQILLVANVKFSRNNNYHFVVICANNNLFTHSRIYSLLPAVNIFKFLIILLKFLSVCKIP